MILVLIILYFVEGRYEEIIVRILVREKRVKGGVGI